MRPRSVIGLAAAILLAAPLVHPVEVARAAVVDDRLAQWQPYIAEASQRFGIPEAWIRRVIAAESGGRTQLDGRPIRSRAGAIGLMQLMPGTWAMMRVAHGLGPNPDDPRDNILAGTAYLRAMYDRFGWPGCFAAYNAGPGRYAAYLARQSSLPAETIAYLGAVTGRGAPIAAAAAAAATQGARESRAVDPYPQELLFALRRDLRADSGVLPDNRAPLPGRDGLFVVRRVP